MTHQLISEGQLAPSAAERRHLESIFRGVRHTLLNRGLFRRRRDGGVQEVVWKRTLLLPDLGVIAFEVDDLAEAIAGEEILIEPNSPSEGVWVAFIVHNGAPVEFLQINDQAQL